MATNEEYKALIDSLSSECEKLHKMIKQIRQTGEWIRKESMGCPIEVCSKCSEMGDLAYNFCPWCGADMRGADSDLFKGCKNCKYSSDKCESPRRCNEHFSGWRLKD